MSGDTTTTAAAAPAKPKGRWGVRSVASLLIFIIAAVFTPIALVGHWGHRTVIDSQRYIDTVGPLINDPAVQESLAWAATDAVVAKADTQNQVEGLLNNLFPDSSLTGALASPIASGINSLIGELVTKFIASDQFATVWIRLNEVAQRGLVAALEGGDSGPVQVKGPDVVLDISSAFTVIQQYLVESGITAAQNITIPESDRQIVLMSSPALEQVRFVYSFTSPILQWFPLVIAAMFALSIALARRRARTVVATGIVLVVTAFVLIFGLGIAQAEFENQLENTPFGPASSVFWDTLLAYLIAGIQAVLTLGLAVIVAGWFGGRTKSALYCRGQVVTGLTEIGQRLPAGLDAIGAFAKSYQQYIRWAIYVLVMLIIMFGDLLTVSSVLWCVILAAGLVTGLQVVVGAAESVRTETSDTPVEGLATTS